MNYDVDGNLAALRVYEREQDELDRQDRALEDARSELAWDMVEAYFECNESMIEWVQDYVVDEHYEEIEAALRSAVTDPEYDIKAFWRELVVKVVEEDCETDDFDSIESARRGFGI